MAVACPASGRSVLSRVVIAQSEHNELRVEAHRARWEPKQRHLRLLIVAAGILLGQAILYGPSLIGTKVLLPLDILADARIYVPRAAEVSTETSTNPYLFDLVSLFEPARRFAISEYQAGRIPMWNPYQYAGAPFIWPKFSPFLALESVVESPVILAWTQLLAAMVAGVGMYRFCRRVLVLGFWPAAVAGWIYPLTGFFILWQGFATGLPVYWLPWVLLAVNATVRRTHRLAPVALAVVTGLVLVSGHVDVAGQVLLVSGFFAIWCLLDAWPKPWRQTQAYQAMGLLAAGWGLGFMLAAPQVLPAVEYAHTGARFAGRGGGHEERPPVGVAALPQVVLPKMYGSLESRSYALFPEGQFNLPESSAATYIGLLATLFLAPLAFYSQRHRGFNRFALVLCAAGLGWTLNIPGLVQILRWPGLNLFSHNRFVFAASFALLALAATGLEVLGGRKAAGAGSPKAEPSFRWSKCWWIPPALLALIGCWSAYRAVELPEPIATEISRALAAGKPMRNAKSVEIINEIRVWFGHRYAVTALLSGVGVAAWLGLRYRPAWMERLLPVLVMLLLGDLIWSAKGLNPQCDPKLYYPPVPALGELAKADSGRVIGYSCLPASLASMQGLRDIRGYDGVDPLPITELLNVIRDPKSTRFDYALTQGLTPQAVPGPNNTVRVPPILNMLGVTHVIFRGSPPARIQPVFQSADYWVLPNPTAMPRTFVPREVQLVAEPTARLDRIAAPQFDPRAVAYVEVPVELPPASAGEGKIIRETPVQVKVSARMDTAGLLVLADRWDKGWKASVNGSAATILRVNHALRGVILPAGESTVEFRYAPGSFTWGLRLAAGAGILLAGWAVVPDRKRRKVS